MCYMDICKVSTECWWPLAYSIGCGCGHLITKKRWSIWGPVSGMWPEAESPRILGSFDTSETSSPGFCCANSPFVVLD